NHVFMTGLRKYNFVRALNIDLSEFQPRFIGELFKLSMLTENIMHDCIFRLLKARDDESLLSLRVLITAVGSILDTENAKQRMDQYFAQMIKIAEDRKPRIKFALKDVIELRQVPSLEQTLTIMFLHLNLFSVNLMKLLLLPFTIAHD
ncbi:eukaryotic translation initiation factor 4 gamma, partial [Plakobranchus ocellatus]